MAGTVTCTPLPDQGGFRIFIDWSAAAEPNDHLKVERIVAGQPAALVRPAYAPTGPVSPALGYRDSFTRIVANGWGNPDLGPPWTTIGTAANTGVNGTQGFHSHTVVNTFLVSELPVSLAEPDLYLDLRNAVTPTGNNFNRTIRVRSVDANNFIDFEIYATTAPDVSVRIRSVSGGVSIDSGFIAVFGFLPTASLRIRVKTSGTFAGIKVWSSVSQSEPTSWTASLAANHTAAGKLQIRSVLQTGVTNPLPVVFTYDNLIVASDPDASLDSIYHVTTCSQLMLWDFEAPMDTPVQYRVTAEPSGETVTSTACVFASGGNPWLIDPLSPCHNIKLAPCRADCPPGDSVIWLGHEQEQYTAASAQFEVIGKRRPIEVSQIRRDAVTSLAFATVTCEARDKLLALTQTGTPVFIPAFDEICWPDRYLALGDHAVIPLSRDLRRTERLHTLPAVVVDAPAGPTCCVTGASWCDLCSCAATWNDMDALGLNGRDVLEGEAVEGFAC